MKALSDRVHHATDHTHRAASSAHHASCSEEHLQVHIVEELDDRKPLMSVGELAKGVMYHESMKTGSARALGPHPRTVAHCWPLYFVRSSTVRFIRMRTRAPHPARGERGVAHRCPPLRPVQAHARIPTAPCALAALRCAAGQTTVLLVVCRCAKSGFPTCSWRPPAHIRSMGEGECDEIRRKVLLYIGFAL